MTDKELQRLKRVDLLELLISQSRENEMLQQQLEEARQSLAAREIKLAEAGSIAEAALSLNGVFEAAQKAAEEYLESVKARCAAMEAETEKECRRMLEATQEHIQSFWRTVGGKKEKEDEQVSLPDSHGGANTDNDQEG